MKELLANPAFRPYVISAVVLAFNPILLGFMTGAARGKHRAMAAPEDARLTGATYTADTPPAVQRLLNAHRNALETIPIGLVVGLIHVLAGAGATAVTALMGALAAFRWFHTIAYLREAQPWRSVAFAGATGAIVGMMIHALALVLA